MLGIGRRHRDRAPVLGPGITNVVRHHPTLRVRRRATPIRSRSPDDSSQAASARRYWICPYCYRILPPAIRPVAGCRRNACLRARRASQLILPQRLCRVTMRSSAIRVPRVAQACNRLCSGYSPLPRQDANRDPALFLRREGNQHAPLTRRIRRFRCRHAVPDCREIGERASVL
jgi:hypothetical protein